MNKNFIILGGGQAGIYAAREIRKNDKESNKYIKGVACDKCFDTTTEEQKLRYMSRQKQVDLAKKRNQKHIGPKEEVQIRR